MAVSNTSKTAAATFSNATLNSATMKRYGKAGAGWTYDQADLTYDALVDPVTNLAVLYDGLGTLPVFTNQAKNVA